MSTLTQDFRGLSAALERRSVPGWPLTRPARIARRLVEAAIFGLIDRVTPVEAIGRENLAAVPHPAIFVANHNSHLDTPAIRRALPPDRRDRLAVAAAADYFFNRPAIGGAVAIAVNAFPVPRGQAASATIEPAVALLRAGWSVLIYPEGTRSPDGRTGAFKPGAAAIAVETGVPVVPIHVSGTQVAWPKGRRLPRPGRIAVRFGRPLWFERSRGIAAAAGALAAEFGTPGAEAQSAGIAGAGRGAPQEAGDGTLRG